MLYPRKTFACAGLLALAVLCTGAAAQAPKVNLRYKFKAGETVRYAMDLDMIIKAVGAGKEVEGAGSMKFALSLHTLSVERDGKARVALKFERMQIQMDILGQKVAFDTDDETNLPEGVDLAAFKALRKEGILATIDRQGRATDMKIPEALDKKEGNNPLDLLNLRGKGALLPGELIFPAGAVVKGQSWKGEPVEVVTPIGKLKQISSFSYEGTVTHSGRQLEKITARPKVEFQADPNAPAKVSLKTPEAPPGTLYFDRRAGRLVEAQQRQDLDMEFEADCETIRMKMQMKLGLKLLGVGK